LRCRTSVIWGLVLLQHRQVARREEISEPEKTAPTVAAPPKPIASNVIEVLADIVQPADRRKRFEIEDVHRAYVAACEARGAAGCLR
jgi:hypothetical protein